MKLTSIEVFEKQFESFEEAIVALRMLRSAYPVSNGPVSYAIGANANGASPNLPSAAQLKASSNLVRHEFATLLCSKSVYRYLFERQDLMEILCASFGIRYVQQSAKEHTMIRISMFNSAYSDVVQAMKTLGLNSIAFQLFLQFQDQQVVPHLDLVSFQLVEFIASFMDCDALPLVQYNSTRCPANDTAILFMTSVPRVPQVPQVPMVPSKPDESGASTLNEDTSALDENSATQNLHITAQLSAQSNKTILFLSPGTIQYYSITDSIWSVRQFVPYAIEQFAWASRHPIDLLFTKQTKQNKNGPVFEAHYKVSNATSYTIDDAIDPLFVLATCAEEVCM